jgi:signal transduction histidine kinase
VRTAVLLETALQRGRGSLWAAPTIEATELGTAYAHAWAALDYLARDGAGPTVASVRIGVLAGGLAEPGLVPRHFVTLPLVLAGVVFGVFQLEGAVPFRERDLRFVNVVASQLAAALQRHRVLEELAASRAALEQANRRLQLVHEIAGAAIPCTSLSAALSSVLAPLCAMFRTPVADVLLLDPDGRTLRRGASIGFAAGAEAEVSAIGTGAAGRIATGAGATTFVDLDAVDGLTPSLRASGARSLLGAPMRSGGRLTGVVYVATRHERRFNDDEKRLIELVAGRIGTVMDSVGHHERALAAIESRDVVLGIVSHDLSNPLGTIQMCLEMLPTEDPLLARPVSMIKRAADVMQRLISDLRDIASIEAGRLSIRRRSEDAHALVAEVVEALRDRAGKKALRVVVDLPARPVPLDCDGVRIAQLLTNLLTNAIKFTPAGGTIGLRIAVAGTTAHVSVDDEGCGIRAADLPKVFDRYWQAKETAHLGSGLGLAISRGIAQAHGSTIEVDSRVDEGTTFSFTLPLAR